MLSTWIIRKGIVVSSNMQLNEAVQKAINENLNGLVAQELRSYIETAQRNAERLKNVEAELERVRADRDGLQAKLNEHRSLDSKLEELNTQKGDLEKRELQLRMDTAMNRALVAEASLKTGMEVMSLVFRNATISQSVLGRVPVAVEGAPPSQYNSMGSPGFVAEGNVATTTTTTQS